MKVQCVRFSHIYRCGCRLHPALYEKHERPAFLLPVLGYCRNKVMQHGVYYGRGPAQAHSAKLVPPSMLHAEPLKGRMGNDIMQQSPVNGLQHRIVQLQVAEIKRPPGHQNHTFFWVILSFSVLIFYMQDSQHTCEMFLKIIVGKVKNLFFYILSNNHLLLLYLFNHQTIGLIIVLIRRWR